MRGKDWLEIGLEDFEYSNDYHRNLIPKFSILPNGDLGTTNEWPLSREIVTGLRDMFNISAPNSMQAEAIPLVMAGSDAIILSQTGSGKTLVFLGPMLHWYAEKIMRPYHEAA